MIQPKDECDPKNALPSSCPRRRFEAPPDKPPMPAMASNRKVLEDHINEQLGRVEDNSASDMAVVMYNTAQLRSGYPLTDTAIITKQDDGERGDQDQKFTQPTNVTTNPVNTACHRQWDEEEHSLVKDYIGEEGDKERHGSQITYDIESSKEMEVRPTYQGNVSKRFDKAYKGSVFKLTVQDTYEEHDDQDQDKLFRDVTEVPAPRQRAMEKQNLVEDHRTREDVKKIVPLDALYPMMRVLSDSKKQQTYHRMSAMSHF